MRDWITKDFWWKLFSVILAVAIWVTIHKYRQDSFERNGSSVENTYGDVPVFVVSATGDVHDFRVVPNTVSVTVNGSKNVMGILQANQIHAFVDLSGFDPNGKNSRRAVQISAPSGVTLINVDPQLVGIILPPKTK